MIAVSEDTLGRPVSATCRTCGSVWTRPSWDRDGSSLELFTYQHDHHDEGRKETD